MPYFINQGFDYHFDSDIPIDEKLKRLQKLTSGLHELLPPDPIYTYSVLVDARDLFLDTENEVLSFLLALTPPRYEVLFGVPAGKKAPFEKRISAIPKKEGVAIQFFEVDKTRSPYQILANEAAGNFLFFVDSKDFLRPDILFRYEETLRLLPDPLKTVLYCDVRWWNPMRNFPIFHAPAQLPFPYFFEPVSKRGVLVPAAFYRSLFDNRLDKYGESLEFLNLFLELSKDGLQFFHVPFALTSASGDIELPIDHKSLVALVRHFVKKQNWHWKVDWDETYQGLAISPAIEKEHFVHIVVPYRDQKEMTLKCVDSVLAQEGVRFQITAIDNNSEDASIAASLIDRGCEVIQIKEPFNFSRLINHGVFETELAKEADVIFFLNNDVELLPDNILEMLRWIDQPKIGMVGCRLHYPDGRLQHGGASFVPGSQSGLARHDEVHNNWQEMKVTRDIRVVDVVTAAAALMKKELFIKLGGFDELWYPIGYSDVDLAIRIERLGLYCFYTPFSVGIHYVHASRGGDQFEDFDSSWWLKELKERFLTRA